MADVNISKFRAQVVREGSKPATPGFVVSEGQNPVDPAGSGQNHLPVTIGTPANGLAVTEAQVLTIDKAQIFAGTSSQFVKGDGTLDSTAYGTGSVTSVALTMPSAFSVAGSPITTDGTLAVTGAGTTAQYIRGDGTLATFPALTGFVPYTGATADVNLGTHDLAAERGTFENNGSSDTLTVNHTSGSGYGIIVTKGGSNEALYVSKTSGSGNAMTVVGGRTSLVDLALSSVSNTAGDFLTLSGGVVHKRTAGEVRTDIGAGTVTSVGLSSATSGVTIGSTPVTGSGTITIAIATASGSQNGLLSSTDWTTFNSKQNALTNPVTGTGTTNYLPKFTGSTTIGNSNLINDSSGNLGLGVTPSAWNLLKPIEIGNAGNFFAGFQGGSAVYIGNAAYYSSGWKYATTGDGAGLIDVGAGAFTFSNAASGTAGNSLTWTPRLNITLGGNLLVGTTTDGGFKLDVAGNVRTRNTIIDGANNGNVAKLNWTRTDFSWSINNETNLRFYTSSGNTLSPSTQVLEIATSGSATFSSSVTATQFVANGNSAGGFEGLRIINASTGAAQIVLNNSAQSWLVNTRTDNHFSIFNATSSTTPFLITTSGNVGIGTSSPNRLLTVSGTQGLIALNATSYRNTTIGSDSVGNFIVYDDTAAAYRMVIKDNGNVLIGTTTDNGSRFQVSGGNVTITNSGNVFSTIKTTTNTGVASYLTQNDINTTTEIGTWGSTRSGFGAIQPNNGYIFSGDELAIGASLALKFGVGGSNTERMRITSAGNVSIGSTSDTGYRLFVSGNTYLRSGGNTSASFGLVVQDSSANNLFLIRNDGPATFASSVTANNLIIRNSGVPAAQFYRDLDVTVVGTAGQGIEFGARNGSTLTAGAAIYGTLDNPATTGSLVFQTLNGGTLGTRLSLASTGAATFSSSVTATSLSSAFATLSNYGSATSTALQLGDANNGLFRPALNSLAIATNGATALTLSSTGAATFSSSVTGLQGVNVGVNALGTDRMFQISGTAFTSGGNQFSAVINPTMGSLTTLFGMYLGLNCTSATTGYAIYIEGSGGSITNRWGIYQSSSLDRNYFAGNVLIGTTTDVGAKLYVNGGIRTANPTGSTSNDWLLGRALTSGTSSPDRWIRVQIGNLYYDILAVYMGSV